MKKNWTNTIHHTLQSETKCYTQLCCTSRLSSIRSNFPPKKCGFIEFFRKKRLCGYHAASQSQDEDVQVSPTLFSTYRCPRFPVYVENHWVFFLRFIFWLREMFCLFFLKERTWWAFITGLTLMRFLWFGWAMFVCLLAMWKWYPTWEFLEKLGNWEQKNNTIGATILSFVVVLFLLWVTQYYQVTISLQPRPRFSLVNELWISLN